MTAAPNAVALAEQVRLACALADEASVNEIQAHADYNAPGLWWDIRPLLDERERPARLVDLSRMALAYAELRGLVQRHPTDAHLVRITRRAARPLPELTTD